jgi:2-dehydro-3-deoxyphosphogluconate aldolase/(4S)-4-hydroxy-2-oxoglutarate aldolase
MPIPADIYSLSKNVMYKELSEITTIPFLFVSGLKEVNSGKLIDIMRGEEGEVFGLISELGISGEAVFMLAGTHNKIICTNKNSEITEFKTTMSGELLDSVINNTILRNNISHDFNISEAYVIKGANHANEHGLTATLFETRVMAMNGIDKDSLSSFVYGAVLSEDIDVINEFSGNKTIYISGRETLKAVYSILLNNERVISVDESVSKNATHTGLKRIYTLYKSFSKRDGVLKSIEKERIIAIVRAPKLETFEKAVEAMYNGGIKLIEVTFDRSGKIPKEETARLISMLCEMFGNDMYIGAGTVTCSDDVMLAYNAGASFIISPNCDEKIIKLSRKLGLVSIPAALTPTEIIAALDFGADYIKLFPADAFGKGYIKAITAPITDARILAVGGVTTENAGDFIREGFAGIGVGSNLYNKKLIDEGRFDEIEAIAKKYVEALK